MYLSINKKRLGVAIFGISLFGVATASAATLGGLTSRNVGANDSVVAACDTDGVTVAYTVAYSATSGNGRYTVSGVTVSGINTACVTQTLSITLRGAAGVALGAGTVTVTGATQAVTITGTPSAAVLPPAELVTGAAIVIL